MQPSTTQILESWDEPLTGTRFIRIPGGTFLMGAPEDEQGRCQDEWLHEVTVDPFWIGQLPVTNRQYQLFDPAHLSGKGGFYSFDASRSKLVVVNRQESVEQTQLRFGHPDKPVMSVSWNQATAFNNWMTKHSGHNRIFDLPTEAQWEFACRAHSTTARFWGDDPAGARQFANVYDLSKRRELELDWKCHEFESSQSGTTVAGALQPNPFGLYDMLGNVWEWCKDIYDRDAYLHHSSRNPLHLEKGNRRVRRGGGWLSCPYAVRSACRRSFSTDFSTYPMGFRLVMIEP